MGNFSLKARKFSISILTYEQLCALRDLLSLDPCLKAERIIIHSDLFFDDDRILAILDAVRKEKNGIEWILALPEVLRMKDESYLQKVNDLLQKSFFIGILSGSLEGIGYFSKERAGKKLKIFGDHNLYLWNHAAIQVWKDRIDGGCLPLELRESDQKDLLKESFCWEKIIYGRIPMMLTANCIGKTSGNCLKAQGNVQEQSFALKDRYGTDFPVRTVCDHCFNVIYNSVPLSLHEEMNHYDENLMLRIQLTTEDYGLSKKILDFFLRQDASVKKPPFHDYTKGHEKKSAQ